MEIKQAFKRAYGCARAEYNEHGIYEANSLIPEHFDEDMGEIIATLHNLPDELGWHIAHTARELAKSLYGKWPF